MLNVICFGEALIDFLSDSNLENRQSVEYFGKYPGGAPANVAVAIAKLGGVSYFAGMLGNDSFGHFLFQSMHSEKVNTDYIIFTSQAKTGLAFVSLDEFGERTFEFYRPPAADLLFQAKDFESRWFDKSGIFHFCSNSLTEENIASATLKGIKLAAKSDWIISFDVNIRHGLWLKPSNIIRQIESVLHFADIIKMSREELLFLSNDEPTDSFIQSLLVKTSRLVIVTDGENPLLWYTQKASGIIETCKIKTLDSTAAGDAFVGGLLYQMSKQVVDRNQFKMWLDCTTNISDTASYASQCGAHAASKLGAFPSLPTQTSLNEFRENHV